MENEEKTEEKKEENEEEEFIEIPYVSGFRTTLQETNEILKTHGFIRGRISARKF